MRSLFSDGINLRKLSTVQKAVEETMNPNVFFKQHGEKLSEALKSYHEKNSFQIWDTKGSLILHSDNTSKVPLSNGKTGLSNLWLDNKSWRVYTDRDPANQLVFGAFLVLRQK